MGDRREQSFARELAGDMKWGCKATLFTLGIIAAIAVIGLAAGFAGLITGSALPLGLGLGLLTLAISAALVYFGDLVLGDGSGFLTAVPTIDDSVDRRVGGIPVAAAGGIALVMSAIMVGSIWRFSPNTLGLVGPALAVMPAVVAVFMGVRRAVASPPQEIREVRVRVEHTLHQHRGDPLS